jgi:hypothetical protein
VPRSGTRLRFEVLCFIEARGVTLPGMRPLLHVLALLALGQLACSGPSDSTDSTGSTTGDTTFQVTDRAAGERAPRTAACDDDADATGCLLPWPSSAFTSLDPASPTGVRLSVQAASLEADDDTSSLNRADGFSRMTPIMTGFDTDLDPPAPEAIRLFLVEPGSPETGEEVPLRIEAFPSLDDPGHSLLVAMPRRPLAPNAEYVVVVTDALHAQGGGALAAEHGARVALGLEAPASQEEADLFGYHAPGRAVLAKAGVDAERALRVWGFTTRSADDATRRLVAMREAAQQAVFTGKTSVEIDSVTAGSGAIAAIVEGRLTGLPSFASKTGLTLDDKGLPVQSGAREAPFRIEIPQGSGDYRFLMFGHGTGGSFHDTAFDEELASMQVAKVGISFYGWTSDDVLSTFLGFTRIFEGSHSSTASLMQAVADGAAVQTAMGGQIGDALAAPMLGGAPNPAAGRRPDGSIPLWAGGSLGGTMGLVFASADPEMSAAVLNVPGAGWTHFIPGSSIFGMLKGLLKNKFGGDLPFLQAFLRSQTNWDDIDGALWIEALEGRDAAFLIQESIGDPVLPNAGSENVATITGATQVGAVLMPIGGLKAADKVEGASGITQYRVPDKDPLDIHGFAARDVPAGVAAREQIRAFVTSVYAGKPLIEVPPGCPGGSCDFGP